MVCRVSGEVLETEGMWDDGFGATCWFRMGRGRCGSRAGGFFVQVGGLWCDGIGVTEPCHRR